MCFDTKSSLTAWVIANSIALYLFYRNKNYDRWNAAFIVTFTLIQLLEAGVWWTDAHTSSINSLLTKLVLIVLLLQPLIQSYFGFKYTRNNLLKYVTYIYFAMLLWGVYRIGTAKPHQFHTSPGPNGHLVWHDSGSKGSFLGGGVEIVSAMYLLGLFVPLLFAKERRGLPLLATGVLSAVYSMNVAGKDEFSSLWCYYAVIYSVVALCV